ncbi:MAG: DNA polymerase I [Bacteroidales bacterium]|nr:DNA polymerase I [Bacteroidales bacterium]
MKNLYLIDGHSLIFRMYYAFLRRPMINSKGEDTSILFGFTKYLLELIAREQPTHLAVMFDPPAKTFRHELYPEYKATRTATPELVKAALEPLTEIVRALDIPVLMKPGFEADDVIGTLARRFAAPDCDVFMVTPDKDLGQIVDDHVYQYKPGKGGGENEIVSKEAICSQYGIDDPMQIVDILAIWGDAADNVKGVDGVGEVGARKLVAKYGSVEGIEAHLDELPPRQQEAFRAALPHLGLSKTLVTIKTDVDIDADESSLQLGQPDEGRVAELFNHYEFNSLRGLVPKLAPIPEKKRETLRCTEIPSGQLLEEARRSGRVAVRMGESVLLACVDRYCSLPLAQALPLLSDPAVDKCGFGLKHTALKGNLYDVEIMHYLLNPERSHKLDTLAAHYLDAELSEAAQDGQMMLFDFEDRAAARECVAAGLLEPLLRKELQEQGLWELYTRIEMPLIGILARMEADGVRIDTAQLAAYSRVLSKELVQIEQEARDLAGEPALNLSSPRQIGVVLYEKLGLNPRAKKNQRDNYPTDEETLTEMADRHPIIGKILEFRAVKKLLSTYIDPLPSLVSPVDGKVHTTYTQALTATGRLSSVKPNLQNIPIRTERGMKIREAFVPSDPDGWIVSADYSQIELRLMAHLSGDEHLVAGFAHGADVHRATAARIFHVDPDAVTAEQRRHAKVANFGIIYGISAFGLSQRMGISRTEARDFIAEYFKSYPGVKDYMDRVVAQAREKGYVETLFGRKRFLPDINSKNAVARGLAERNAINAPIQGGAADIIKLAMIAVSRRLDAEGLRSRMVLQVHDELVFDVTADERDRIVDLVKQEMENVCTLSVPLLTECNYGKNWREAH